MSETYNAQINDYTIRATFVGTPPSPLDPKNANCSTVRIINNLTKRSTMILTWSKPAKDSTGVLFMFYGILQTVLYGSLNPEQFCAAMGLDPNEKETEIAFAFSRENAARLATIINTREELVTTIKMIEQKLGLNRKPKSNNGEGKF